MNAAGLFTPENFEFFARYVLAGFILMTVRGAFLSGKRPKPTEVVLDSIFLSLINQLLFLVLVSAAEWTSAKAGQMPSPSGARALFFAEVVVLPSLLGLLWGVALARSWGQATFRRLLAPNLRPEERAYDYAFLRQAGPSFVIVTFKDGTQVFGYFGRRSLAATDERRSDMYLERLYSVRDGGWIETETPRLALLMIDDVRSIEFIPEGGLNLG